MESEIYFSVKTPLDIEVGTTVQYWKYIVTIKHPVMKNKAVIQTSDEIRESKMDKDVFFYYKQFDRPCCVVVKHTGMEGFLITAYPVDKVKEGDVIWTR